MMIRFIALVASATGCAALMHIHCPDFYTSAHVNSLINLQPEDALNRRRLPVNQAIK